MLDQMIDDLYWNTGAVAEGLATSGGGCPGARTGAVDGRPCVDGHPRSRMMFTLVSPTSS